MPSPIAITGATGALGGRVARLLAERGVPQRLVVRDAARAPRLPNAETAVATYEDHEAMVAALRGSETMLLVSAHEARDRVAVHAGLVLAAAEAGVRRVVYTSFLGAAPHASFPFAIDHHATEALILDAGLELTALRNSLYADVAPAFAGTGDVLRAPAGTRSLAWVARRDVARVAAEVLRDDAHAGHVYDVTGPEPLDLHETVAVLSAAVGRTVLYEPQTPEEARESRRRDEVGDPVPDWLLEGWIGSYLAIATGELAVTSHSVEAITGERPWTLAELLEREPEVLAPMRR